MCLGRKEWQGKGISGAGLFRLTCREEAAAGHKAHGDSGVMIICGMQRHAPEACQTWGEGGQGHEGFQGLSGLY